MKRCNSCAIDVGDDANFCPNCGGVVMVVGAASQNTKSTYDQTGGQTTSQQASITFQDAITLGFKNYVNFNGRASKGEFWWFFLFCFLGGAIVAVLNENLGLIFNLAVCLPFLAVTTRRLHDTDRSGWFQLLYFIPLLGALAIYFFCSQDPKEPNRFN